MLSCRFLCIFFLLLCASGVLHADEGMWLLPLIQEVNMKAMKERGLELSAEEIYDINHSSLKDAIGALNYGECTSELISPEGLLLTNHHCGFDEIQNHTNTSSNYLRDGFWARTRDEELPNPGKTVSFVVSMENVTELVLCAVHSEMTEAERDSAILQESEPIIAEATSDSHYEGLIVPFYNGNQFYLVILETYRDVRLVGAPPESIGKFGHDTDNWEWPRHNADFCLFRIYTSPEGKPADYSIENIPLKSKYFLPVSLEGYKEGDFSMVMGYPGSTYRYMSSFAVREKMEIENKNRIKIRSIALELMNDDMMADEEIRIRYASKYSSLINYYKYARGMNISLEKLNVLEKKRQIETDFVNWAGADSIREQRYGQVLESIGRIVSERKQLEYVLNYLEEMFLLYKASEVYDFAASGIDLFLHLLSAGPEDADLDAIISEIRDEAEDFFREYSPSTDKKITAEMLKLYAENVKPGYHPGFFGTIDSRFGGDYDLYTENLFRKSIFVDKDKLDKFLARPSLKKLRKDPAFKGALGFYGVSFNILDHSEQYSNELEAKRRLYMEGLMEMYPDSNFYPDANSTLRLSYGKVQAYKPFDAVRYNYYTTLGGVIEKEDPDDYEFILPPRLKDLFMRGEYGIYGENDTMRVCFITDNDITGGNSGSPVLNARGELIGLAFDGNWEAMSGDIMFEPALQRCINVDIRYILFIISEFAEAGHLIDEMTLIR